MSKFRIDFAELDWNEAPFGSRFKAFEIAQQLARMLELRNSDEEADWCTTGHIGFVFSGELEIEFPNETVIFKAGDGLAIPAGDDSRHKPRPLTDSVVIFLVDQP